MGYESRKLARVALLKTQKLTARFTWVNENTADGLWMTGNAHHGGEGGKSGFQLLQSWSRLKVWHQVHEAIYPAAQFSFVLGHYGSVIVWNPFAWQVYTCWRSAFIPTSFNAFTSKLLGYYLHSISKCIPTISIKMGNSNKTTAPLTTPFWLLSDWISIPLTSLT